MSLARLERLAWLLDSSIPIPGTRARIGLDAVIGLVPWLGDLVGVAASCYILAEAARLGASASVLGRMALNVALEGLLGAVPLVGDVFDAAWKANRRNVRLLAEWLERPARAERASSVFLMAMLGLVLAVATLPIALVLVALRWLGV